MDSSFSQVSFARLSPTDSSRTEENWSLSKTKCWGMERKFSRKLVSKGEGFCHGFSVDFKYFFLNESLQPSRIFILGEHQGFPKNKQILECRFLKKMWPRTYGFAPLHLVWLHPFHRRVICQPIVQGSLPKNSRRTRRLLERGSITLGQLVFSP